MGGDEFVVVLEAVGDASDATRIAEQLQQRLDEEWELGGRRLRTGASVGLAVFPDHVESSAALLRIADEAMYRSKRVRAGSFRVLVDG